MKLLNRTLFLIGLLWLTLSPVSSNQRPFADTIAQIKPSIVGIGSFSRTRQPTRKLWGTGFVVADGNHVVTNWHVVDKPEDDGLLSVMGGTERQAEILSARIIAVDKRRDLALLRFDGPKKPAMAIADSKLVREGEVYGFTGFPIGQVMGLYPVTHKGMVAAITPYILPKASAGRLTAQDLRKLKDPFRVFQLDGTAYPGNSGSPLYRMTDGAVVGVLNKVFVSESKENVLSKPSGISFAIPSQYVRELLVKGGLKP